MMLIAACQPPPPNPTDNPSPLRRLDHALASIGAIVLLFAAAGTGTAHQRAATPPSDPERLIRFPDIEGYRTLVVDLHTHSAFSDGHVWPRIRVGEALRDGLDALAITEHLEWQPHRMDIPHPDHNRAYETALEAAEGHDILIIPGAEITREAPAGHMNAVFISDANQLLNLSEPPKSEAPADFYIAANEWPPEAAVQAANDQDAFVFWNHAWWSRTNPSTIATMTDFHRGLIEAQQLHGIEIVNGHYYAEEAFQMALDYGLTPLGVSDVHNLIDWDYRPASGGHRPVTLVFARERTPEALREALFDGRTVVWFKNLLLGRETHVLNLLRAALDIKDARYRPGSLVVEMTMTNNSDATMRMRNLSSFTFAKHGDYFEIPAHGAIRMTARVGKLVEELLVEAEVTNTLIAPKTHPRMQHRLKLDIPSDALATPES